MSRFRPAGRTRASMPVLVVGAGPAGLTTAIALARHGVEVVVVDRRGAVSGLPRAASVSTRTMELLRSWGLEADIRSGGVDVEWKQWVGHTLASAGDLFLTSFPTREQSAVLSPTSPASVPQDHLEPILSEHLRSFDTASIEMGTELVDLAQEDDLVRVTLRDVGTDRRRTVMAGVVVAADGTRSHVRRAVGIGVHGPGSLSYAIATEFRAPLWDLLDDRRFFLYAVTHPDAPGVFVPAGVGDRWIYGVVRQLSEGAPTPFTEQHARRLIRVAAGRDDLRPEIERIGTFTFAAGVADRFRAGRVFLVGDAAHQITPRGGTGMNSAIQSGYDLGWKLGWVLRGWAPPAFLDTYESERRPVVAHNVERSADPEGGERTAVQELPADLGGRIGHRWLPGAVGGVSTLDLLGEGLTLLIAGDGADWRRAAARVSRPPVAVHDLDALTARGLGVPSGGALLVRPDGAPAGWWPAGSTPATALQAAIEALTGGHRELERASGGSLS